jgi:hypothetical protein
VCPGRSPTQGSKNNNLPGTWGYFGGVRGRPSLPHPADLGGSRGSRAGVKTYIFNYCQRAATIRAAEGPPSGPPPFLVEKVKLRAGPREPGGGPGRPPGPPRTLRNSKKPSRTYMLMVPFRSLLRFNKPEGSHDRVSMGVYGRNILYLECMQWSSSTWVPDVCGTSLL